MSVDLLFSVKDLSKEENLLISYYLYKVCQDVKRIRNLGEAQTLYNTLVETLGLEEHSRKVIHAFINKHVKDKLLTPRVMDEGIMHPFNIRGAIDINYKEDETIYDKCGEWVTDNLDTINQVRAVFASKKEVFTKIIACTFFCEPNNRRKTFTIPDSVTVPEKIVKNSTNIGRVKLFVEAFKLSEEEGILLNFAYLSHVVSELHCVLNEIKRQDSNNRLTIYSKCTGLSMKRIKTLLHRDKKLVAYDIMDSEGDIEQDALDCIYAGDLNVFFCDVLKKDEKNEVYALNSFSVKEDESTLALRLLKNGASTNLLLYGAPGSGKTEYARALVKESGLTPFLFKNELEVDSDNDNPDKHALYRLNCLLSLEKKDSVIIVDEAESVLSTRLNYYDFPMSGSSGNGRKGTVNTMLEKSVNKVIWILNYTKPLDESTLRRFTYSIHFREMNKSMLRNIAASKLSKLDMSDSLHAELVDLCGKYHVTGASVDNMIKTVQGMDLTKSNDELVVSDVQKVLEANSTLIYGKKKMREKVRDSYDLSILNTSTPAEEIVDMVLHAQKYAEENGQDESGIRMLFYGLSGTGKTELARYIAEKLNKKICLKRVSDIMSMWVGESEKNIADAFAEAEASGDVLLFDEADSFFANRQDAVRSWERTLVNEFLTQMEEFSGILICTTNLRSIMDPAMQRRFHILAEFKPLRKEAIAKLLGSFFPAYSFDEEQVAKLEQFNSVTPGDFGSLTGKIRFMDSSQINSDFLVNELCKIQEEKDCADSKRIGFAC